MNLYKILQEAIESFDIDRKEKLTQQCLEYCSQNKSVLSEDFIPIIFKNPSYFDACKIVSPKALKARKDFDTKEGLGTLVHAIAHIEYSAIDLALDAVYRFPLMPQAYKLDWLEVALDEIRHYKMLETLLHKIGYSYGDFSVHSGLFDVAQHTAEDVLDRMAIVPRYYEASGLDVNPQIIKKLDNKRKLPLIKELIESLNIIYEEEIVHVQKGDRWFKWICKERNLKNSIYFEILEKYNLIGKHRPHINVLARKEAGFSCDEIKKLADVECY
ncbi:MAG TPA: ferritin-like domain-containing protein [Campylobacterales bacterium]|nr:ferritin-like domain-containing protein [Campylobacterales bacterium]HIP40947.1 ferritin-like domain-containing protein [Campylobacterales bacterium]